MFVRRNFESTARPDEERGKRTKRISKPIGNNPRLHAKPFELCKQKEIKLGSHRA
jgi:hypothetical protein